MLIQEHEKHPDSPYMFPSPATGEMYYPDSVVKLHEKMLRDAGLEHIRFHDLRHTFATLTRLSARYARMLQEPVAKLSGEVLDHAEKANSIFPSDPQRIAIRKAHLLEARASLMALDVRLTLCYDVMSQNPEGAFTTSKGKAVSASDATVKLDKMAQSLGDLIDRENELLKGAVKALGQKQKPQ